MPTNLEGGTAEIYELEATGDGGANRSLCAEDADYLGRTKRGKRRVEGRVRRHVEMSCATGGAGVGRWSRCLSPSTRR